MAAINALNTLSFMGYSIEIPEWVIFFLLGVACLSVFRAFYDFFRSSKKNSES